MRNFAEYVIVNHESEGEEVVDTNVGKYKIDEVLSGSMGIGFFYIYFLFCRRWKSGRCVEERIG